MSATVIDLVSDSSDDETNNYNDDEKKPPPKHTQGGKRKIGEASNKKEPNRKNPCPTWSASVHSSKNNNNTPAQRVSPGLLDEKKAEDEEEEEVILVGVEQPSKFNAKKPTKSTAAAAAAALPSKSKPSTPPRIWLDSDSANITYGMLPKLRQGGIQLLSNAQVSHIQQKDQWSCGFRNIQMLLSSLVPLLSTWHPYFQSLAHIYSQTTIPDHLLQGERSLLILPSLTQLQQQLEACWKEGFDPSGADHFKGSVVGRHSRIGAVEVGYVFTYWWLDACVVQFIKCFPSRRLLAPFVYRYFHGCSGQDETKEDATRVLTWAEKVYQKDATIVTPEKRTDSTVLPMYLQWEGHSVTVVGIEPPANAGGIAKTNWSQWNLVVFCPSYDCSSLTSSSTTVAPFRVSCRVLQQKDCQLILAGWEPLTEQQRRERRNVANVVTAAKDAVVDYTARRE